MAFGKVYVLRAHLPRREVEDAPPPDRVLDGRAGDGLRRPRRRHGPGRGLPRPRRRRACVERRRPELAELERDVARARAHRRSRSRASPTARRSSGCARPASDIAWGDDFGGDEETALSQRVRPSGHGPPLPGRGEGLLHEGRSRRPAARALRRRARARGLRRDHRRRPARGRPRRLLERRSPSTGCRARRSTGTSTCAATARCRTPASAWASSAPSRGSAACTTCARPSRSRACSSACAPSVGEHRGYVLRS